MRGENAMADPLGLSRGFRRAACDKMTESYTETAWVERLRLACAVAWSGQVNLMNGENSVGSIVVSRGKIAWAVCRFQPEDLGSFLCRIGKVSREQLTEVQALFNAQKGKRKLGALLEEAGYISRAGLRHCLLLHIRMAVGGLFRHRDLIATWHEGSFAAEEDLTFPLDLFLRQPSSSLPPFDAIAPQMAGFVDTLSDIDGYRAAFVATREGEMLGPFGSRGEQDDASWNAELTSLIDVSSRCCRAMNLGEMDFLIAECSDGVALTTWLDNERSLLVGVLMNVGANIGMAKYRLSSTHERILVQEAIQSWAKSAEEACLFR